MPATAKTIQISICSMIIDLRAAGLAGGMLSAGMILDRLVNDLLEADLVGIGWSCRRYAICWSCWRYDSS